MQKKEVILLVVVLVVVSVVLSTYSLSTPTGRSVKEFGSPGGFGGPSDSDMKCMQECVLVGCDKEDMACKTKNSIACGEKCGVETTQPKPEDESEKCMQECISIGCAKFDIACENKNIQNCETTCNMKGDAPDESTMSEEELCISSCVAKVDPSIICGSSKEGETGNAVCQKCASECVHLYEGPCLNDEQISSKEKECATCEHCYGDIIKGPSGEGWECIVDVVCADASSEFGDDSGSESDNQPVTTKENSKKSTSEEPVDLFNSIANFFGSLFG